MPPPPPPPPPQRPLASAARHENDARAWNGVVESRGVSMGGGGSMRGGASRGGRGGAVRSGRANSKGRQQRNDRSVESRVKSNFARNRNIVIGKKPSSGTMSWGGADLTVSAYIGRVALNVSLKDIETDLLARGVNIVWSLNPESFPIFQKEAEIATRLKNGFLRC